MYHVDEKQMERLLTESDNVSRYLAFGGNVPVLDRNQFFNALLAIQTNIRGQKLDKMDKQQELLSQIGQSAGA